jgi:hypothetical protein
LFDRVRKKSGKKLNLYGEKLYLRKNFEFFRLFGKMLSFFGKKWQTFGKKWPNAAYAAGLAEAEAELDVVLTQHWVFGAQTQHK